MTKPGQTYSYNHARAKADALDKKLLATDKRLSGSVLLVHQDGSVVLFNSAFALRFASVWIIVLTEHHGAHVYHSGDLRLLRTFGAGAAIKSVKP